MLGKRNKHGRILQYVVVEVIVSLSARDNIIGSQAFIFTRHEQT
jgi:hypothetical protein